MARLRAQLAEDENELNRWRKGEKVPESEWVNLLAVVTSNLLLPNDSKFQILHPGSLPSCKENFCSALPFFAFLSIVGPNSVCFSYFLMGFRSGFVFLRLKELFVPNF